MQGKLKVSIYLNILVKFPNSKSKKDILVASRKEKDASEDTKTK